MIKDKNKEFSDYLVFYYEKSIESWKLPYRKKSHVNTNMFSESIFSRFKSSYLERIKNNRLDILVIIIIQFDSNTNSLFIRSLYIYFVEEK